MEQVQIVENAVGNPVQLWVLVSIDSEVFILVIDFLESFLYKKVEIRYCVQLILRAHLPIQSVDGRDQSLW